MNILYVNDIDLPGARFNGHNLQLELNKRNIPSKQIVLEKRGNDPNTIPIVEHKTRNIEFFIRNLESNLSIHSLAGVYGRVLLNKKEFVDADIVHYHLVHNSLISLLDLPDLMSKKPSVWTFHDPWVLTGHCIHPIDCDRWNIGCGECPHLDRIFPMKEDNSAAMWKIKEKVYAKLDVNIIVASKWMLDMVKSSPLTSHFDKLHLIPFGVDPSLFSPKDKAALRKKYEIPLDDFVIFFRAEEGEFKGIKYIKDMLNVFQPSQKVTLVTVGQGGLIDNFQSKFSIKDFWWVDDPPMMSELYSISDIFLMPSIAEAFGLMAIEAMASGLPIIVFNGTALPAITFAPECGIAIEKEDSYEFASVIERLMNDEGEREKRSSRGIELAKKHYDLNLYHSRLIDLYEEIYRSSKT